MKTTKPTDDALLDAQEDDMSSMMTQLKWAVLNALLLRIADGDISTHDLVQLYILLR